MSSRLSYDMRSCGIGVITCPSHGQGPQFDSGLDLSFTNSKLMWRHVRFFLHSFLHSVISVRGRVLFLKRYFLLVSQP